MHYSRLLHCTNYLWRYDKDIHCNDIIMLFVRMAEARAHSKLCTQKYAYGSRFVVFCCTLVQVNFTHIPQGFWSGWAITRLSQCMWNRRGEYGKVTTVREQFMILPQQYNTIHKKYVIFMGYTLFIHDMTVCTLLVHAPGSAFCQLTPPPQSLGFYSLCDMTSYRKISRSLEAARPGLKSIISLWNLTGVSAAMLLMRRSNFRPLENI